VAEQQLHGGIANAGRVVRVGPHVLRPSSPHSGSIHAFLRAVRHAGYEGASSPVGIDEDGRERLVFIDGEVPLAPYPDWSQSDTALASIARLLRGLHDAARGFDPQAFTWDDSLADPAGGTLVCSTIGRLLPFVGGHHGRGSACGDLLPDFKGCVGFVVGGEEAGEVVP
jgi:hypothetical protein